MRPPLFYRLIVNPIREWRESDDRLRVEHFRATFKPVEEETDARVAELEDAPAIYRRPVGDARAGSTPAPCINLLLYRGERRKIVA